MKLPWKALNIVFWTAVAGVGVAFAGSIVTAVQNSRERAATETTNPSAIATPAIAQ